MLDEAAELPDEGDPRKVHKTDLGGRPFELVPDDKTLRQVNGIARIQCTLREAAAVLGVHVDTFRRFLGRHEEAKRAWEDGFEQGKVSLRRAQFKNALSGGTQMQIWLGKQTLDQRDKTDSLNTNDVTGTLADVLGRLSGHPVFPGDRSRAEDDDGCAGA